MSKVLSHRRSVFLFLGGAVFAAASVARADTLTYDFVNYPSIQNGYTIIGQIITDGAQGTLAKEDVLSWSYSVVGTPNIAVGPPGPVGGLVSWTQGDNELYLGTSSGTGAGPPYQDFGIYADAVGLHLPQDPWEIFGGLDYNSYFVGPYYTVNGIPYGPLWEGPIPNETDDPQIPGYPNTILLATLVPEPSTLALLIAGAVGLLALVWRRKMHPT